MATVPNPSRYVGSTTTSIAVYNGGVSQFIPVK
jgi:hypothetical protein